MVRLIIYRDIILKMPKKKRKISLIVILIIVLIAINYNFVDNWLSENFDVVEKESFFVSRVIDGDTVEIENLGNKESVRLIGINTPERGEEIYGEAKTFLESQVVNKTAELEYGKTKRDQYGRTLAYIYINNENVNEKIVENGYGNVYFLEDDKYEKPFRQAWEECLVKNINLCEKSEDVCSSCIDLEKISVPMQAITLYNTCDFSCSIKGWSVKDEGRKKFTFGNVRIAPNSELKLSVSKSTINQSNQLNDPGRVYWVRNDYVWTQAGDSVILRDDKNKLVLFFSY